MNTTSSDKPRQEHANPWWKTQGVFFAGGWHPLTGRIRRGGIDDDLEDQYAWEYSEQHIQRLKEVGVVVLISQFDRGLGDSDQAQDQELARRQAELCHRHGLHHGVYLANTVYFESMLKDEPDCEDWVARTQDGRFIHYGGEQTWRWVACFNAPGWRARMKRQIDKALDVVRTDWLHFDNLALWPDACHCRHCQERFREFLRQRYPSTEAQKQRFGYTGFDTFRSPTFDERYAPAWKLDRFHNPLMQDWLDFRCETVTAYIRDMVEYARAKKPDVAIDGNAQSIWGVNQALLHGIDQEEQARYLDVVCEENPDYRPLPESAAGTHGPTVGQSRSIYPVTRKFRGMNFHRRLGKSVMTGFKTEEELAFNLTFCGDPGINSHWGYAEPGRKPLLPHQPGVKALLDQFQRHRELYLQAMPAARTAVWRSKRSLRYVNTDTHLSACVMEHILFTHRIPFSIIQDGWLNPSRLEAFDLLIMPNAQYLSDEQVRVLMDYVRQGGRLLVTEQSGAYHDHGRRRTSAAFADLFAGSMRAAMLGQQEAVTFDPNRQFEQQTGAGETAYAERIGDQGAGRAVYLPKIDYLYRPHAFESRYNVLYDGIDSRYWQEPHNVGEILDAIRWLHPGCQPVRVLDAPELRMDYLRLADGSMALAMMRCGTIAGPHELRLIAEGPAEPRRATLHRPEQPDGQALTWRRREDDWETVLPAVGRHAVVTWSSV